MEPIGGIAITSIDFEYESKTVFVAETSGINKGITAFVYFRRRLFHIA